LGGQKKRPAFARLDPAPALTVQSQSCRHRNIQDKTIKAARRRRFECFQAAFAVNLEAEPAENISGQQRRMSASSSTNQEPLFRRTSSYRCWLSKFSILIGVLKKDQMIIVTSEVVVQEKLDGLSYFRYRSGDRTGPRHNPHGSVVRPDASSQAYARVVPTGPIVDQLELDPAATA